MVRKATNILSAKLQTRVEIRSVNIAFFNKVVLNGVYVEDLNKDTLLYADHISASINSLPIFNNTLTVGKLQLSDGEFHVKSDTSGININRIIKNFTGDKQKDTTKKTSDFDLSVHAVELQNFAFSYWKYDEDSIVKPANTINFKDIRADIIQLKAYNIRIYNDTISFRLGALSLKEKSGFRINSVTASGYVVPGKDVHFDDLEITDDYSELKLKHYSMEYDRGDDFADFVNKVVLSAEFEDTQLATQSLGYFAASMQKIPIKATVNGLVNGTIANLKTNNLTIKTLDNTIINGRFSITGLPNINEAIIFADFKQLRTNPKDVVAAIVKTTGKHNSSITNFLSDVNQINFKGSFTGLYNDFVANGNLSTNLGTLKLDVLFKSQANKDMSFEGRISTPKFDAGKFLKTTLIGQTKFNLMMRGIIPQNGSPDLFSEGVISEVTFNNYKYENINLSGTIKENEFNGSVDINDPNIDLVFTGKINYKGTPADPLPVFDFQADFKHIDLAKLNFDKRDSISEFQGKMSANFKGNNIANYAGEIKLTNVFYTDATGKNAIGEVSLIAKEQNGNNSLQLLSEFVEAQYIGPYKFGEFIDELLHITYMYLPSLEPFNYNKLNLEHQSSERYEVKIKTKKPIKIASSPTSKLYIAENSIINLLVDTTHIIKLNVDIKQIGLNDNKIDSLQINTRNTSDSLFLRVSAADITVGGIELQNIFINNSIKNNIIATHIAYKNETERENTGNIFLNTNVAQLGKLKNSELEVNVRLLPSKIMLNDSLWRLAPAHIKIDSNYIAVKNFKFYKNSRYLTVNGAISHNPNDTITVKLSDYDLGDFNYMAHKLGYKFTGNLSGSAEITSVYNNPLLMINMRGTDITVNNDTLGNITVASHWDEEYERLNIITRVFNSKEINANINGFFTPKTGIAHVDMIMYKLKFKYIEPLLTGIVSHIEGNVSGDLFLRGNLKDPALTGKINLNQTALTVDYLQTRYKVDATIDVEKDKISITNGTLYDLNNNKGTLNVTLNHNNFNDINFDALATINNMLSLNTKAHHNPLFYGTTYATGGIRISGTPKDIRFDITAQSEANSILYIPLPTTAEAKNSSSMLSFKKNDTVAVQNEVLPISAPQAKPKANIDFGFDLTVTPETEIQILIDKKAGDILRAQGQGNLKINVNPAINQFDIRGNYQIKKGDYNFTIPNFNLISRKFTIEEGSKIDFKGDVTGAILDINASYRTRASLKPLLGQDTLRAQRRHLVDCKIYITGKMANPTLRLAIEFPNLDAETKAQIMSYINTEEKVTTQFLSLLVASSFIPIPEYGYYNTASVLNNATDLLSGQISSLISMLDLPIPLDVDVDVGVGDKQQISEFEVTGSTVLFDRVLINGSVSNNTNSNRDIVGDAEMEVLLDKRGRYRAKVFTRSSDYFTNDLDVNMQGVGISYQTDFDNFMDLFRRKRKPKKESENKENQTDSENNKAKNNTSN